MTLEAVSLTRRWWLTEMALVSGLALGWISAYVAATQNLDVLTSAQRRFQLELFATSTPLWVVLVIGLLACAALLLRHWSPLASLVVVAVLVVAAEARFPLVTSENIVPEFTLAVATFWAARTASGRRVPLVLIGALMAFLATAGPAFRINPRLDAIAGTSSGPLNAITGTLLAGFIAIAAFVIGRRFRQVNEQAAELAERNAELAAERQARADRAVHDERVRIARELHDVVAHHVTSMTLHAGAARQISELDPARAGEAIRQVEASGRDAVAEMHRLLGFLRGESGDDDRAPTPTLDHLDRLIDSMGHDLTISVTETGERREMSPTANLSAYRIVQEALTNAAKHSGANRVEVEVNYLDDEVELKIVDDGTAHMVGQRHGLDPAQSNGSGHGLIGMRERALLHDGFLEAGPRDEGGWLVRATLRYRGSPQ